MGTVIGIVVALVVFGAIMFYRRKKGTGISNGGGKTKPPSQMK